MSLLFVPVYAGLRSLERERRCRQSGELLRTRGGAPRKVDAALSRPSPHSPTQRAWRGDLSRDFPHFARHVLVLGRLFPTLVPDGVVCARGAGRQMLLGVR